MSNTSAPPLPPSKLAPCTLPVILRVSLFPARLISNKPPLKVILSVLAVKIRFSKPVIVTFVLASVWDAAPETVVVKPEEKFAKDSVSPAPALPSPSKSCVPVSAAKIVSSPSPAIIVISPPPAVIRSSRSVAISSSKSFTRVSLPPKPSSVAEPTPFRSTIMRCVAFE